MLVLRGYCCTGATGYHDYEFEGNTVRVDLPECVDLGF